MELSHKQSYLNMRVIPLNDMLIIVWKIVPHFGFFGAKGDFFCVDHTVSHVWEAISNVKSSKEVLHSFLRVIKNAISDKKLLSSSRCSHNSH